MKKTLVMVAPLVLLAVLAYGDDGKALNGDDLPRVSKNQARPSPSLQPGIKDVCGADFHTCDDDGGTGGSGTGPAATCILNHKCTGGSICATGNCVADADGKSCQYCTGYKCKSVRC